MRRDNSISGNVDPADDHEDAIVDLRELGVRQDFPLLKRLGHLRTPTFSRRYAQNRHPVLYLSIYFLAAFASEYCVGADQAFHQFRISEVAVIRGSMFRHAPRIWVYGPPAVHSCALGRALHGRIGFGS